MTGRSRREQNTTIIAFGAFKDNAVRQGWAMIYFRSTYLFHATKLQKRTQHTEKLP